MEIYRNAGKKTVALLDPFAMLMKAFVTGIQHNLGGEINDILYKLYFTSTIQLTEHSHLPSSGIQRLSSNICISTTASSSLFQVCEMTWILYHPRSSQKLFKQYV